MTRMLLFDWLSHMCVSYLLLFLHRYAKLQHLPGSEGHRLTHDERTEIRK